MPTTTTAPRFRWPAFIQPSASKATGWAAQDWGILAMLLLFAVALRLAFFNGFFGSDDLVYLTRSMEIAQGTWTSANYNGSLRYGYNIPAAFFIYVFGLSRFAANAWTLLCSLAEVGVVYVFAARFLDRRAAIFAAIVIATIPLHIALSTRIHADAVLALFLTLSFVLFYAAEQSGSRRLYVATGLSLGMIFWVKELAVITLLAFATYPLILGRLKREWAWVIGGGLIMLVGHLILMKIVADDPLHLIKTVLGQLQTGISSDGYDDSPEYYFRYLFLDIRHTWIAPFLAAIAIALPLLIMGRRRNAGAMSFVAWWLIGLLVVLSFMPVSFSPLRLAMKQSNYLNLFLAPIALLSGTLLARMPRGALLNALVFVTVIGGIALGAVSQHAYQTFTANGKAAVDFMRAHPDDWMLGSVNNKNMARVISVIERDPTLDQRFGQLSTGPVAAPKQITMAKPRPGGYAILDFETLHWGSPSSLPDTPPECWQRVQVLEPDNRDAGYWLLRATLGMSDVLPNTISSRVKSILTRYLEPRPATVYRVEADNLWCQATRDVAS
jgi:hypothetical protein